MNSLDGKVAIVTGAASKRGMGHAIALRLAGAGAKVVVIGRSATPKSFFPGDEDWGGLDAVVAEIKALDKEALAVVADVSDIKSVEQAVAKTLQNFGKIDILVHCAAISGPVSTPIVELAPEDWKTVLDINLTGSFFISKVVAGNMIARQEGKIVLISSTAGTRGVAGSGAYCSSKWGVIGLMKTLALELAPYKINVNAINAGAFVTNIRDKVYLKRAQEQNSTMDEIRETSYRRLRAEIPLGRLGKTDEIADLVFFLVSDLSTYITGEAININGGMS